MTQHAPTRSNFHSHLGFKMGNCPRRVVIHAHVDVSQVAKPDPEPALEQEGTAEPEVASRLASSDWDVIAATPEQRLRRVASFTRGRALPVLEGIALPLRRPVEQIPTAQQLPRGTTDSTLCGRSQGIQTGLESIGVVEHGAGRSFVSTLHVP